MATRSSIGSASVVARHAARSASGSTRPRAPARRMGAGRRRRGRRAPRADRRSTRWRAVVGVVKPQVAFFERHGGAGYAALERVIARRARRRAARHRRREARRHRDHERGYADAWLARREPALRRRDDGVVLPRRRRAARALRARPRDGPRRVRRRRELERRGPRACRPRRTPDGRTVEAALLDELTRSTGPSTATARPSRCLGAVVGAQRRPAGLDRFEGPVLVPGIGAQGCATPTT